VGRHPACACPKTQTDHRRLDENTRERVITDLERVDQLCGVVGQLALQSVLAKNPSLLSRFQAADSDEGRAIIVLLEDETAFDRAFSGCYADSRRNGRNWSGYTLSGRLTASNDPSILTALESEISNLFRYWDGTGRRLKIDHFDRQGRTPDGGSLGLITHYSIYVEGQPESDLHFDQEEPKRRTRRPVHEEAISYCPERRTVEVLARGGRKVRNSVAHAFARHVLGVRDQLKPIVVRPVILDCLKQPMSFPTDSADGVKSVRITLLRLRNMVGGYGRVTIETDDARGRTDIHAASADWFGNRDPLTRPDWSVEIANLKIVFFSEKAGGRDKTITITLRWPNGSNLKNHIRHHQILSEKYLARWGLIAATQEG